MRKALPPQSQVPNHTEKLKFEFNVESHTAEYSDIKCFSSCDLVSTIVNLQKMFIWADNGEKKKIVHSTSSTVG